MPHHGLRNLACLLLLAAVAACSETTLRRNSLSAITIADQSVSVSWVEVPPRSVDLIVTPDPATPSSSGPLTLAVAEQAAGLVAARRCLLDRARPESPPVHFPGGRFVFRYICGQ